MDRAVKVGVLKIGCVGSAPLLEFLIDERADRKDVEARVVGTGAKMDPSQCEQAAKVLVDYQPDIAVTVSPNATLPGPKKGRELLLEAKIPTVVISDSPTAKITKDLEKAGFGYFIVQADAMIGARREFLDPVEMTLFNADAIRVLAITGVFKIITDALDAMIDAVKANAPPPLPRVVVTGDEAVAAAGFQNPYAAAKARSAFEIARRVAPISTRGCFVEKDWEKYTALVAAAHEMMHVAALLADEAREMEKATDSVVRTPHNRRGIILRKTKLIEKPTTPE